MRDLAILDVTADLGGFEPVQVPERLIRGRDCVADGVVSSGGRRTDKLDKFVNVSGHKVLHGALVAESAKFLAPDRT